MIDVNINPVLFELGSLRVSYYALVWILGFLISLWYVLRRKKEIGLKEEEIYDLAFLGILGVIIGARVFHVLFWGWSYYSQDLIKIFYIWQGGFSFHGGLVGGLLALWLYGRKKKLNIWKILDVVILPVILVLALGRVANFINAEILGKVNDLFWCVKFSGVEGCRHPVQLYAATGRFVLFGFLVWLKKFKLKDGILFWTFIFLIGLGRFFCDFFREGELFFGLLVGQWFSLIMVFIGGYVLGKNYRKELKDLYK